MRVTDGMKKIGPGLWWGHCPKIGEDALVIQDAHRTGDWTFSRRVAEQVAFECDGFTRQELWFQMVDKDGQWLWSHGIVNARGRITQIG